MLLYLETIFCKTFFFTKITIFEHRTFKWNPILWSLPIAKCIQKDYSLWINHNCSTQISKNWSILWGPATLPLSKNIRTLFPTPAYQFFSESWSLWTGRFLSIRDQYSYNSLPNLSKRDQRLLTSKQTSPFGLRNRWERHPVLT